MRERFERGFEAWAGFVSRWRWAVVAAVLALTAGLASQAPNLELDTSTESYLLDGDPVRVAYDAMREQFGRDQVVLVAFEPADVFDLDFLSHLGEIHRALEDGVPHLDRITSLVNVRSVYGLEDELVVGDLLEDMPASDAEMAALRERVLSTPSYLDGVISRDGRLTVIIIETDAYSRAGVELDALAGFDDLDQAESSGDSGEDRPFLTAAENAEIVEAVKAIVAEHRRADVPTYVSGSAAITHEVSRAMAADIPKFFGGSLAVIATALFVLFRRLAPCIIALAVVTLSVAATFGFAGALGQTLSILSQILPSFLLSVGVGYSVHLLAIYFQRLDAGDPHDEALAEALRHSGPPIAMTAVTTMAGLASFLAAAMPPIRDFGLIGMGGVIWTLLFNLTLLPALLCIFPVRARQSSGGSAGANRALLAVGMGSARHPWKVVAGGTLLAALAIASSFRLQASNNPITYLAPEAPFRIAFEHLNERMGNTMSIEIFIDAGEENALYEPEAMNRLDRLGDYVREFEHAGHRLTKATSIVDIAKETHQALNANDSRFYAVPQSRQLLAQELLLFENSGADDIERVVDSTFRLSRYSIASRFEDGNLMAGVVQQIQDDLPGILGDGVEATVTGASTLIARTVDATTESLARTYAIAFLLITPLMMLLIGSLRSGLVSMAPNLLPILLTLGLMPAISIPLDVFTMMVGCISIGLAVDDTLHFIHGFRTRLAATGDPYLAIEQTLQTTGRALLFTSIVLSAGFLVFTASSMGNLRALGVLTAFSITAAFVLDIIVTPALLVLVTRGRTPAREAP